MRIKILGEVTPDRLLEAFEVASAKIGSVSEGAKVFGANLYLTSFDSDGIPFDLGDENGNSLIFTLPAKEATLNKPEITAIGRKRLDDMEKSKAMDKEQDAQRMLKDSEDWRKKKEVRHAQIKKNEERFESRAVYTDYLFWRAKDKLLSGLNMLIERVWSEQKPIDNVGQPIPPPRFLCHNEKLCVISPKWKSKTPMPMPCPGWALRMGDIVPYWSNQAWLTFCTEIGPPPR